MTATVIAEIKWADIRAQSRTSADNISMQILLYSKLDAAIQKSVDELKQTPPEDQVDPLRTAFQAACARTGVEFSEHALSEAKSTVQVDTFTPTSPLPLRRHDATTRPR